MDGTRRFAKNVIRKGSSANDSILGKLIKWLRNKNINIFSCVTNLFLICNYLVTVESGLIRGEVLETPLLAKTSNCQVKHRIYIGLEP
jgi:hypothetical protein